jgi:glycosyltransferase involved in cell wall biosynthesis
MAIRKVLMTTDTVGGVWNYALELAGTLGSHGVTAALATMGAPLTASQEAEVRGLANVEIYPSTFKLEWMEDPWPDVAEAGEWLLWIERCFQPDVVHLNNFAHGALAWRAPVLVVGHSCVLSWWEAVKREPAPESWRRYRREVARGLQSAQRVVAPSRWMLERLDQHYGPLPEARVVPNGRSAAAYPTGHKEPLVLSAGRLWDEAKNVSSLERIAGRLPWPVYVAGEEQHPDGGRIRPCSVRALGRLSPAVLSGWLSRAAIYALPARYEPFGLSVLEAALAGCALVIGDIPSLREIWGDAAVFVPPEDPVALEAALRALMGDEPARQELAERARRRALEFDSERMAARYLSVYGDLLGTAVPEHVMER